MNGAREMKKILMILGILLILCPILSADLLTAYKKGEIAVVPDPSFGAKVEWDMLFKAEYDKNLTFRYLPVPYVGYEGILYLLQELGLAMEDMFHEREAWKKLCYKNI
jgi:hypothetical protein